MRNFGESRRYETRLEARGTAFVVKTGFNKVYRATLFTQDRVLTYNASAGVIMANQSLVLRGLTRQRNGDYRCIGVNSRGEGVSNAVELVVRYAPVCRQATRNIRGAERSELVDLSCAVDSLPRPIKYRYDEAAIASRNFTEKFRALIKWLMLSVCTEQVGA